MEITSLNQYIQDVYLNKYLSREKGPCETLMMIMNGSNFTLEDLALWMFIACDEDGNVLKYPDPINEYPELSASEFDQEEFENYKKYKERCLFEGWKIFETVNNNQLISLINSENQVIRYLSASKTFIVYTKTIKKIDDLLTFKIILKLTPAAEKYLDFTDEILARAKNLKNS